MGKYPSCGFNGVVDSCPSCGGAKKPVQYVTDTSKFAITHPDHFYISVHGVEGIRLRVDSPTIDRLKLKTKVLQFCDSLQRNL